MCLHEQIKEKLQKEIFYLENQVAKFQNLHSSFDYVNLNIASPEKIKLWAIQRKTFCFRKKEAEIKSPETVHFKNFKPVEGGLFCQIIFGPINSWVCACGRFEGILPNVLCPTCHVELTDSRVRRYRMGYISLPYPVSHFWYLRGRPSYISLILNQKKDTIENILYYREIFNEWESKKISEKVNIFLFYKYSFKNLNPKYFKSEKVKKLKKEKNVKALEHSFKELDELTDLENDDIGMRKLGGDLIYSMLDSINLVQAIQKMHTQIEEKIWKNPIPFDGQWLTKKFRRLRLLENFFTTNSHPKWMMLTVLPVLPPTLRPILQMENGTVISSDLNDIYRILLFRNKRISTQKKGFFLGFFSPRMTDNYLLILQDRKNLQEIVDVLIDNSRLPKGIMQTKNNRPLLTLTENLEGKEGRFRKNLLGKRVDYSARSVIVVGPKLKMNQCGLPFAMAKILFQPFLIQKLLERKEISTTKFALLILERNKPIVFSLICLLAERYSILLNRAPTLHKFGIQGFDPIITSENAIQLHPLVCSGFNADFDGDQMGVHLPIYDTSQLEVKGLMKPSLNILSPANGEVIIKPSQDIVIGAYYLTLLLRNKNQKYLPTCFPSEEIALNAFFSKKITLHNSIFIRYSISSLTFKIIEKSLIFSSEEFPLFEEKIEISRILYGPFMNAYFFTQLGLISGYKINENIFRLSDFFLETTVGRIIFGKTIKQAQNFL